MKQVWAVMVILALAGSACEKDEEGRSRYTSPTGPSSSTTENPLATSVALRVIASAKGGGMVDVDVWGNVNAGLRDQLDPNGGNIRIREYSRDSRWTYIVGWANGTPVGGSNVTTFMDVPTAGKIDMAFYFEPYKCTSPTCWVPFTFPESRRVILFPENFRGYRFRIVDGEVRLQADSIPPR